MGERREHRVAVDAATSGAVIGVWYSLPDVVTSRRARGWIKAGLLLANGAVAGWATRGDDDDNDDNDDDNNNDGDLGAHHVDASADRGNAPESEVDLSGLAELAVVAPVIDAEALGLSSARPGRLSVVRAAVVALAVLGTLGSVAAERAIHQWGERRAARGVRGAHTRIGVAAGIATAATIWALEREPRPGRR
ncbi:hypothetical protein A6035_02465 [Dietzia lutea]|uniref:Uncharacterized protein n=1 Tax=Dietzia lutea TaxID=546160 RepID=A0A2S1R4L1_9ACTN|nr:hypothetical protein A6035_02465 [Dietzia lutea]